LAKQFYTILTAVGKAKIANAAALGNKIELTEMALGDGGGSYYNPTEDQTSLRNEVWRGAIGNVDVDGENPNWIIIQAVVLSQHGGFMIREAGVFDDEGDLIAVGKYPETYKPAAADGSIKDLVVRMILEVSNTASVVLKVDPTVVATQQQVDEAEARAKAYTDRKIGVAVPIGSIIPWTSTTIPDGWLECNGQAVSRTGFSELFAKIGTTFGAGDGSTTFNIPDLRGEFIRGWDHGRGVDSGRAFGSWQAEEFKAHNHVTDSRFNKFSARASDVDNQGTGTTFDTGYSEAEYRTGHMNDSLWASATIKTEGGPETRPRNVALMFIIKAKNVAGSDPAVQGANADTLDGFHASAFALSGHIHPEYALADHTTHAGEQLSFQQNGYCKLANGLIIQWGGGACASTVTFPIKFPRAVFSVTVNGGGMTNKSGDNAGLCPNDVALTGFTAFNMGDQGFASMYWTAIGY